MTSNIINLTDAGALAAILGAVDGRVLVARVAPDRRSALIGSASHIGQPGHRPVSSRTDVRELFLFVRLREGGMTAWPVGSLIREYGTGAFVTGFDLAAFEAAGGQASVPASVASFEAAYGQPGHVNADNSVTVQSVPGWLASWEARPAAHRAQPQAGTLSDREDVPVTAGVLPGRFPVYGSCALCGEPVRCMSVSADWAHDREFPARYRRSHPVTPEERRLVKAARDWIADSFDDVDAADLDTGEVVTGVELHYSGGWEQFVLDGS